MPHSMKPRRLLVSVAPLPTITESHEDGPSAASLEDYVNSIKELAQPTCGPVRLARAPRPRLFSKPLLKHSGCTSTRCTSRPAARSRSAVDQLTLSFAGQNLGSRDPVDWLFAQMQLHAPQEELRRTESAPAALRLL